MWTWLNETQTGQAIFSWAKVFLAVVLSLFLADGADLFGVSVTDLRAWVAAGFVATLPAIINALNPKDTRYGNGSDTTQF